MGFPPPPDAPSPEEQDMVSVGAGFQPSPMAVELCGFALPFPYLGINIRIPNIPFPPELPSFLLAFGLNCDLDNPIDVTAGVGYGGGRVAGYDSSPDDNVTD